MIKYEPAVTLLTEETLLRAGCQVHVYVHTHAHACTNARLRVSVSLNPSQSTLS